MFDSPLSSALTVYTIIGLAGLSACLVGASIYDLQEAKMHHYIQMHPYTKHNQYKPLISLIIYVAHNNQPLLKCLKSVKQNLYRKCQIIVVFDIPESHIMNEDIKIFTAQYPKTKIKILKRRKFTTRADALRSAVKKRARGDLVMYLDADCVLDRHALHAICRHFKTDKVNVLIPNSNVGSNQRILSIYEQLSNLLHTSTAKLKSLTGYKNTYEISGIVFRRLAGLGNINKYASDVMVYMAPTKSWFSLIHSEFHKMQEPLSARSLYKKNYNYKHLLFSRITYLRHVILMVLFVSLIIATPLFITLFLYLAVSFKQSAFYGLSWIIFSVIICSVIWGKEHLKLATRIQLTLYIPIMFALFYLMSILNAINLLIVTIKQFFDGMSGNVLGRIARAR